MGDAAAYLRDTLRAREAELTRTIQLVADLKAALTTEQQAREHDAVAADNALAEKDAQIAALRDERDELLREGVKWISDRAEQDAQIAALQAELADFRRGQARHLSKMRPAGK